MATLIARSNQSPQEDAEALQKALEGQRTDEKTIIAILGHRNTSQRQEIRIAYENIDQKDLAERLKSNIKGDLQKAVYLWILKPADRDAVLANDAIRSGKNYHVIVEISTVLSPEELFAVRRAYLRRYKRSLEEDVASHTSGHLRQLLVGLVTSFRYVGVEVNPKLAQSEAESLHEAVEEKKGSNEEAIRILTTRSKPQLIATFKRYGEIHGTSIDQKLLDKGFHEFQRALYTAIRVINGHIQHYEEAIWILTKSTKLFADLNPNGGIPGTFIAKELRNALKRVGIDEDALTRVIVSRAEEDLKKISERYYQTNRVHLEEDVAKITSGYCKKFLLTLLGKED